MGLICDPAIQQDGSRIAIIGALIYHGGDHMELSPEQEKALGRRMHAYKEFEFESFRIREDLSKKISRLLEPMEFLQIIGEANRQGLEAFRKYLDQVK